MVPASHNLHYAGETPVLIILLLALAIWLALGGNVYIGGGLLTLLIVILIIILLF